MSNFLSHYHRGRAQLSRNAVVGVPWDSHNLCSHSATNGDRLREDSSRCRVMCLKTVQVDEPFRRVCSNVLFVTFDVILEGTASHVFCSDSPIQFPLFEVDGLFFSFLYAFENNFHVLHLIQFYLKMRGFANGMTYCHFNIIIPYLPNIVKLVNAPIALFSMNFIHFV